MAVAREPELSNHNQPPPLEEYNLFSSDRALHEAVAREGAHGTTMDLEAYGAKLGARGTLALGEAANRVAPVLHAFDRFGERIDQVEFHPAWHALMAIQVEEGIHCSPWSDPSPGAQVRRAARLYMSGQVEAGTSCPISMTFAAVPVLSRSPSLAGAWLPRLFSRRYDPDHAPAEGKTGALVGMGLTERQGGSDLSGTETSAVRAAGDAWRVDGAKWFFSAPMCDAFLVLARAPDGLACFFMPRWRRDGRLNGIRLQRLKDKLGNRSNASAEVVFEDAEAFLLGEEGRGIATIIEMAALTRLDNVVSSAGIQRQAIAQAIHHARHRCAFGRPLADQPLMAEVLADLAIEVEAATVLAFRLVRAHEAEATQVDIALRRLATPAAKFYVCKRGPILAGEALEVLGGNGYIEESIMPRLYRELPVNSIWEGSGNVMALDVLRALRREPACLEALEAELCAAKGADARLDAAIGRLLAMASGELAQSDLRRFSEAVSLALQGALLVGGAPSAVAEAFCASRLDGAPGRVFGASAIGSRASEIIERAAPTN